MNSSVSPYSPKSSRLLRELSELGLLNRLPREQQFGARLGRLIDLSDSVTLAETLRFVKRVSEGIEPGIEQGLAGRLKELFLFERTSMVEFIVRSFVPLNQDGPDRPVPPFRLPIPDKALSHQEQFKAFQRFYALHQSEIEHQVGILIGQVRKQISSGSERLNQVVVLDKALTDTLQTYYRRQFAQLPRYLESRYRTLVDPEFGGSESGLSEFLRELQRMLLAELELRLQPVLGLVEACENEEIKR